MQGPTTGPICVGHFSSSDVHAAKKDAALSCEVAFKAAHVIEGIHIVPNKVSPAGFSIEGRTLPDIQTRSFSLTIAARDVDRPQQLVTILSMTVSGGCQWMPIAPPFNGIAIDHLVLSGDFEVATVILHGIKLELHMLSSEAQKVVLAGYQGGSSSGNGGGGLGVGDEEDDGTLWWDTDTVRGAAPAAPPDHPAPAVSAAVLSALQVTSA